MIMSVQTANAIAEPAYYIQGRIKKRKVYSQEITFILASDIGQWWYVLDLDDFGELQPMMNQASMIFAP
ncbi:hypothetical protein SLA2020_140040 [Shorea laevis]